MSSPINSIQVIRAAYMAYRTSATFIRILKCKWHLSHWDPSKLTHFNGYFDEDSSIFPRQIPVEMCQFTRIPITCISVSSILVNFFTIQTDINSDTWQLSRHLWQVPSQEENYFLLINRNMMFCFAIKRYSVRFLKQN